ncbi:MULTISPECIES: ATP-binding protein [Streptomyces]|uniref:ATP-binding protein n=1 Tax=Streptomyces huasconensis TaxID=1854574 RepID=A0ABV3M4M5_9ACTN|nr:MULTISPECIES: ATP-binding protein [Streptomyces]UFQ18855.1 ATP-binding protein [Streptomyces huasconensis]WCL88472.1 ATP-binding protein [Streptomyces sp. JCM 35825]
MTRQSRGGGSGGIGTSSPNVRDEFIDGAQAGPDRVQLRRRLGRADLAAVSEVRGALREFLRRWGKPARADIAELLTSELVTNALVHTDHDAVITATLSRRGLCVEVRDFVGRRPEPRVPDADSGTNGRGLILVQSLADAWGVRAHGVGKVVWFELNGGGTA